jgi:hypothetical protein
VLKRFAAASPSLKARVAGVLSLVSLLTAISGEYVFHGAGLEIAGDDIALSLLVIVTLLLYDIFKPVNKGLSLLAASFNVVGLACA